jgi:putative ABC transport system permease protein
MGFLQMAWKNSGRRKLRTLVTTLGVAIAVAALFSLLSFQRGYQAGMQNELSRLGAHVLVVPKGCPYDAASIALHGAAWPCYLKEEYLERVQKTDGVQTAAPLFMNAVFDSKSGDQSVYLGAEPGLLNVKKGWRINGKFPAHDGEFLIGSTVAETRKLKVGQTFTLPGLNGKTGRVSGILNPTNGADDTFFYMPLAESQRLFKRPKELTHILVRLTDPNSLDAVVGGLRACEAGMEMNIVPLTHLFQTIQGMVNSTRTLLGCVALVALLVAGAGVSNTVMMAVTERTREIGVMRAVGASPLDVFRLIWLETLFVCVTGGLIGIVLALMGSRSVEGWLRARLPFSPDGSLVHPELSVMLLCLLGAAILGSLAGLLPAWRAAKFSPVEAIRAGSA